ncbi:MAG: hypothetical protein ACYTX0_60670, partial [Nostoc sp.]
DRLLPPQSCISVTVQNTLRHHRITGTYSRNVHSTARARHQHLYLKIDICISRMLLAVFLCPIPET